MPAQNLDDVLSFIAETLRKDEKLVYRIGDYKVGLHYHEADLQGLVGLEFNSVGRDGRHDWLKVDRLVKEPPPKFPRSRDNEVVAADDTWVTERWVTAPDDPNGQPSLKSSIRFTLPKGRSPKISKKRTRRSK